MNSRNKLARELFKQNFSPTACREELLQRYRLLASGYASMENAVVVLSDMASDVSYIYCGRFASMLGMDIDTAGLQEPSIWEESLFRLVHPEDLSAKHLDELLFFHYIRHKPKESRSNYYLMSRMRMRTQALSYIPVLHRMFYVHESGKDAVWLALCLYSPLAVDFPGRCFAVNSVNGTKIELSADATSDILSMRQRQILEFIDKGCASKEIASILSISKNTVSRHRQEIIAKLQVKNSIEACRKAKDLGII